MVFFVTLSCNFSQGFCRQEVWCQDIGVANSPGLKQRPGVTVVRFLRQDALVPLTRWLNCVPKRSRTNCASLTRPMTHRTCLFFVFKRFSEHIDAYCSHPSNIFENGFQIQNLVSLMFLVHLSFNLIWLLSQSLDQQVTIKGSLVPLELSSLDLDFKRVPVEEGADLPIVWNSRYRFKLEAEFSTKLNEGFFNVSINCCLELLLNSRNI